MAPPGFITFSKYGDKANYHSYLQLVVSLCDEKETQKTIMEMIPQDWHHELITSALEQRETQITSETMSEFVKTKCRNYAESTPVMIHIQHFFKLRRTDTWSKFLAQLEQSYSLIDSDDKEKKPVIMQFLNCLPAMQISKLTSNVIPTLGDVKKLAIRLDQEYILLKETKYIKPKNTEKKIFYTTENKSKDQKQIYKNQKDTNIVKETLHKPKVFIKKAPLETLETLQDKLLVTNVNILSFFNISMKIDTCAAVNILPSKLYNSLKDAHNLCLDESNKIQTISIHGSVKETLGTINLEIYIPKIKETITVLFHVMEKNCLEPTLSCKEVMSRNWDLRLFYKSNEKENEKNISLVSDLDTLPNVKQFIESNPQIIKEPKNFNPPVTVHMVPNNNFIPSRSPVYRVKPEYEELTLDELNKQVELGWLRKARANETILCTCPMVVRYETNKIRICQALGKINKFLDDIQMIPLPSIDSIIASNQHSLSTTRITILDCTKAFHSFALDLESQAYYGLETQWGVYIATRMPMGCKQSAQLFYNTLYSEIGNVKGVNIYIDDIMILVDEKDMEHTILQVMRGLINIGCRINPGKCHWNVTTAPFLGFTFNIKTGFHLPENTIKSILTINKPKNKDQLKSILSKLQYYAKLNGEFSKFASPLYKLCKDNTVWSWTNNDDTNFKKCLQTFSTCVHVMRINGTIKSFAIRIKTSNDFYSYTIEVDQVTNNTTSTILIAVGSKLLTKSELNYYPDQKELLAIYHAIERFNVLLTLAPIYLYVSKLTIPILRKEVHPLNISTKF
uniref:Reverse transcriptase domain-containing protein n=1 Tax=Strongyloides stercoralis TaxID=6248 RepID=A0A0K0EBY2_STRER